MTAVYHKLSQISFLSRNYALKFLFVAFLGIHVPLIGLLLYVILSPSHLGVWEMVVIVLFFTLLGTAITLLVLKQLLKPVVLAKEALVNYAHTREVPSLPTTYTDEIGQLMHGLQTAIEKLEIAEEHKASMMALLSHDLRSPLHGVIGLAEIMKMEENLESIHEMCDMLISSTMAQVDFIDELGRVYKTDSLELAYTNSNISALVTEVVSENQPQLQTKKIAVSVDINAELVAEIDEFLMKQVISNLLVNAIKYSPNNEVITIAAFKENNELVISVKDNGMGMPQDVIDGLFAKVIKKGRKGTNGESTNGLGLYLCGRIIQKHKGHIKATSQGVNQGSVFTITIPTV